MLLFFCVFGLLVWSLGSGTVSFGVGDLYTVNGIEVEWAGLRPIEWVCIQSVEYSGHAWDQCYGWFGLVLH